MPESVQDALLWTIVGVSFGLPMIAEWMIKRGKATEQAHLYLVAMMPLLWVVAFPVVFWWGHYDDPDFAGWFTSVGGFMLPLVVLAVSGWGYMVHRDANAGWRILFRRPSGGDKKQ